MHQARRKGVAGCCSLMNYEMKSKLEGLGGVEGGEKSGVSLFRGTSCVGEPQVGKMVKYFLQ